MRAHTKLIGGGHGSCGGPIEITKGSKPELKSAVIVQVVASLRPERVCVLVCLGHVHLVLQDVGVLHEAVCVLVGGLIRVRIRIRVGVGIS